MDGFTVETTALEGLGGKYHAISKKLYEDAELLRSNYKTLCSQTAADGVLQSLTETIARLEDAAFEARELGNKCVEIADAYNRLEKRISQTVSALSVASAGLLIGTQFAKSENRNLVESSCRPQKPIIFSGNSFPCETWLFDKVVKATEEGAFN